MVRHLKLSHKDQVKARMTHLTTVFSIIVKVLTSAIDQEKSVKGIQIGK